MPELQKLKLVVGQCFPLRCGLRGIKRADVYVIQTAKSEKRLGIWLVLAALPRVNSVRLYTEKLSDILDGDLCILTLLLQ